MPRKRRYDGTGAFAGLWTGVVSAIIGFAGAFLLASLNLNTLRQQAAASQTHQTIPGTTDQILLSAAALSGLGGLVLSILLGLIIGAIGGLIGRRRASRRTLVAQELTYQDVPNSPRNR